MFRCRMFLASSLLLLCWCCGLVAANTATPSSADFAGQVQPKDPTQPPGNARRQVVSNGVVVNKPVAVPKLSSILTSDERRLAVINGKLVREGESVAGMRVIRVAKDEVQLQSNKQAQALVLRLPKSNIGKDYR